ncbi:hypothetical protein [Glycomyces sp. NPDC047010]|uniref:hypothetical protein n=1 Tax=Glycomyces sp. NPDC047010 TaxID=3155023 RepID=UPI0033E8AF96
MGHTLQRCAMGAVAAALAATAACANGPGDREPTAVEASIIEQMGRPPAADPDPAETEAARSEFVAACMAEDDLEYLGPPETPSLVEWLGLTPDEFAAEYGFGHSTTIDLRPAYEIATADAAEAFRARMEALPEADRDRYRTRELACLQESYAEFGLPENGTVHLPDDSPIDDYTAQAHEATADDPRLAEAARAWSDCMAGKGFDFDGRDEMGLPLQEAAVPFADAFAAQGQALVDAGRDWKDLRAADVLDAEQLAALAELQERELAVADADRRCAAEGHDLDAVYVEVYNEHLAELTAS